MAAETLAHGEIAFLLCVEGNRLAPQALLLCESIRTFGGRHREAPIVAVSPRPALAPGPETRRRLEALGVRCVVEPLNTTGSPYGTVNRVVAGAWAETALDARYLVVLDTDVLLVDEPTFVRADVGVRPVDVKGSASAGDGDPLDDYWRQMAGLAGIPLARLPRILTTIDRVAIRASYNGGFAVVRRELGVLRATRDVFVAAHAANLRPWAGSGLDVHASTGLVGREAAEWWGSSQAALAVAIASRTDRVRIYDARYNVPLHLLADGSRPWPTSPEAPPVLLHYHFLGEPSHHAAFHAALERVGCPTDVRRWAGERLRYFDAPPVG